MNILAHLYLSKNIDQLMLGNFMGDFVKGKQYLNYNSHIQDGILLHRKIDSFVDSHKAHKASRDRFRDKYRLHSGIVVDIVYDHFLAKNWLTYNDIDLEEYAQNAYKFINEHMHILPERLQTITPHIINSNWLVLYRSINGIERVLNGMSQRTTLPNETTNAIEILSTHYSCFQKEFAEIMDDLHKMVENTLYLTKFATK